MVFSVSVAEHSMRLIALFNLKPGVSRERYEAWALSVDLPTVRSLRSVERFEVHKATGLLGSEAPPPYQYVEIIDVPDMAAFGEDVASEEMRTIASDFGALADVVFMTTETLGS